MRPCLPAVRGGGGAVGLPEEIGRASGGGRGEISGGGGSFKKKKVREDASLGAEGVNKLPCAIMWLAMVVMGQEVGYVKVCEYVACVGSDVACIWSAACVCGH